jgi:formamidopyrimidine-DNA glycosylase
VPELPEVETVVRSLRPHVVGNQISRITVGPKRLRTRWKPSWAREIVGRRITAVRRRGKWILVNLSQTEKILLLHLGMSGRLSVEPPVAPRTSHTHMVMGLGSGKELRFHDPRRFGCICVIKDQEAFAATTGLGPEPFDVTTDALHQSIHRSKRALKAILLDQCVVAGVGNIYADESLFTARLHPRRLGTSMTREESDRLRKAIVKVLRQSIETKGSTIASFYFGEGEQGGYQTRFLVYDRQGESCRRCGTPIECIRLAGRSTHFCPRCQSNRKR